MAMHLKAEGGKVLNRIKGKGYSNGQIAEVMKFCETDPWRTKARVTRRGSEHLPDE